MDTETTHEHRAATTHHIGYRERCIVEQIEICGCGAIRVVLTDPGRWPWNPIEASEWIDAHSIPRTKVAG